MTAARGFAPRARPPGARRQEGETARMIRPEPESPESAAERWERWNVQALLPELDRREWAELKRRRSRIEAIAAEVYARDPLENQRLFADADVFLANNPALRSGLLVSMHIGPYPLLPAPLMRAGISPVVVLDRRALSELKPRAELYRSRLGMPGDVRWACVDEKGTAARILRALAEGSPVLVYLDGNGGAGGMAAVRDRGMRYDLPGRSIRVQTALARMILRTGCPVHGLLARWRDDGTIAWSATPCWRWTPRATAAGVTRALYDWGFAAVRAEPRQWSFAGMLGGSSDCFSRARLESTDAADGRARCDRFLRAMESDAAGERVELMSAVEVWGRNLLVDLSGQRFWPAAGLSDSDLDPLRWGATPTLRRLGELHGPSWVEFHLLRLYVLGLVRLAADIRAGAVKG